MKMMKRCLALWIAAVLLFTCLPAGFAAAAEETLTAPTNLPAIYITLDEGVHIDQVNQDAYVPGTVSVVGAEEGYNFTDAAGSIKGRGNYSWSAPKKPYNLKFESKTDLLGMGANKSWVLTANYWDKTMLRNYITLMFAKEMGLRYALDVQFVDLYVNGEYRGNYLLSEKIEIAKTRVNIDDENGGVLYEIEQAYRHGSGSACQYCYETKNGVHLMYKEPEAEDLTDEKMQQIMTTGNTFLEKMDASLALGYDAFSRYIDVDSFIDWYIVNEFCKNYDSQFVTSCYCYYDPSTRKLHMGPPWDYDTCYGNQAPQGYGYPEDFYIRDLAPWYRILFQDETFEQLVKERWTELKAEGIISKVLDNISAGAELIDASQKLNFERWPGMLTDQGPRGTWDSNYYFATFEQEVDYLKRFVAIRTVWLDENLNTDLDAPANKLDNITVLAEGMLMDSTMTANEKYRDKAFELYGTLTEEEKALLAPEIVSMFDNPEVYNVEAAIRRAAAVTAYTEKAVVDQARRAYDALSPENQALVSNYDDLLAAEALMKELMLSTGAGNVAKNDITDLLDRTSVAAPNGFAGEGIDNLFDNDVNTKYCVAWEDPLTIQWQMSQPANISAYALATANDEPGRDPAAWTLEGSNDGEDWTVVDTVEDGQVPEDRYTYKEYFCDQPDSYIFYRLVFTKTKRVAILQFSELMLGGERGEALPENVAAVIKAIGGLSDQITHADATKIRETRALYDALSGPEKAQVTNIAKLEAAEAALEAVYAAFNVTVQLQQGQTWGEWYTATPWMNESVLSAEDQQATLDVMTDEIKYQYTEKGYCMRLIDGYYELGHHGNLVIVQSDAHFSGITGETSDVSNPWGQGGRYWSCVIAPFGGMAFSVNGYLASPVFAYDVPLCNAFLYQGKVYQVFLDVTKSHENVPLEKDREVEVTQSEFYPGSGDTANRNTFAYAYATYAQQNKWAGLTLGVPVDHVQSALENTLKYQRFDSDNGPAFIVATTEAVEAADAASGKPVGAYTVSGDLARALLKLGEDAQACFAFTGAALDNGATVNGVQQQQFENGTLVVYSDGRYAFLTGEADDEAKEAAAAVDEMIRALGQVTAESKAAVEAARAAYDALDDMAKVLVTELPTLQAAEQKLTDIAAADAVAALITALPAPETVEDGDFEAFAAQVHAANDAYEGLTAEQKLLLGDAAYAYLLACLERVEAGVTPPVTFTPGDVDKNGKVDVADIMKLKTLIMADRWSDEEQSIGDMDQSGALDVGDIMAVKNIIMSN